MSNFHRMTQRASLFASIISRIILISLFAIQFANAESTEDSTKAKEAPAVSPVEPSKDLPQIDQFTKDLTSQCNANYPGGMIQSEVRAACSSVASKILHLGRSLSEVSCRIDYGEDPRQVMACLIGVAMGDDLVHQRDEYKKRLQLCSNHYPKHTEIDAFFLESCLTGIYSPELVKPIKSNSLDVCKQISPEKSFIGPCAVGLSLSKNLDHSTLSVQQNQLCEQYFDHKKFHTTYRACLNARSAELAWTGKLNDVINNCSEIISDANSDNEKAACVVGSNIFQHLSQGKEVSSRFQKCGDTKVSYEDRDILACLTAASLLDFGDRNQAMSGCKSVYKDLKSKGRKDCTTSLSIFN